MLKLFTSKVTFDLEEYVDESHGGNIAFVLDGFDEFPYELRKDSFITYLIKGKDNFNMNLFHNSTVIVTSRPTATLFLHRLVNRRIEILGFPKEEREKYISLSLGNSHDKIEELGKYLKQHPIINSLCYIPLHLAILVYLFLQNSLPETLTEMNESFIINTIYRYLERNNLSQPGIVKELKDLPKDIIKFVYNMSQLAFEGLQNNQLVFTYEEIKMVCPEVDNVPGAINGFGLLQAVQHYPRKGAGRTTSVSFLHFTMQEYLAAFHVSTLPSGRQSLLMKKTFWDGQFNFMWMMYVGIVGIKSGAFASFIASGDNSGTFYKDKRKSLHLFQCYMEAKSNVEMPKQISSIFTDGKIILTGVTLLSHHISSLIFFMSASSTQKWKVLRLDGCNLGDIGMNNLLEHVMKDDESMSTLEYVDLSENISSPWGVYCAIIRHCCVNSLTLCGDEEMNEYVREIADSLQANNTLCSLTLCRIGRIGAWSIKCILESVDNTTLSEINLSWGSNARGTKILCTQKLHSKVVAINILYDDYHESLPKSINLSKRNINDDALCVIALGLYKNTTVEKLILSDNKITKLGGSAIIDSLRDNTTLKELNLSQNEISSMGMMEISQCITHTISLEYVDLHGNKSSPWGVYCAIIRHCYVNSLTLFGDEEMNEYVREIANSLQANNTLCSLTLCRIGRIGAWSIKCILESVDNTTLSEINLSWGSNARGTKILCTQKLHSKVVAINILYDDYHESLPKSINLSKRNINDDALCVIALGLYKNTTVEKLNLSDNKITELGGFAIIDSLRDNITLKELNLSHNGINSIGMIEISQCITHTVSLEYVDLSINWSSPWGVYCAIIRHCCANSLTLCGDEEMAQYVKEIT